MLQTIHFVQSVAFNTIFYRAKLRNISRPVCGKFGTHAIGCTYITNRCSK